MTPYMLDCMRWRKQPMVQSYRAWVFTLNNPTRTDIPKMWTDQCEFITWQLEIGETGTPHLQGYLVLKANPTNKNGRTLAWVKKNIDPYAHWEERRGSHEQARDYANKTDTRAEGTSGPWTIGQWSETVGQSRGGTKSAATSGGAQNSSKIMTIKRKIDDGVEEADLYRDHFQEMLRYAKGFDRYRMAMQTAHRDWYTKAIVFWGPPHTGKSHRARRYAKGKYGKSVYYLNVVGGERVFWDGYNGQKCVVIEEFYGSGIGIGYMNKLLDQYPFNIETKGSSVPFLAELIIFTSNENPIMWYGKGHAPGEPTKIPLDVLNAFKRRLTGVNGAIIEMAEAFVKPVSAHEPLDLLEQFVSDEFDIKEKEQQDEVALIEAASSVIDLTSDDENGDEYVDEEHELFDKYCEDDLEAQGIEEQEDEDEWLQTKESFQPSQHREDAVDDDINDKTPQPPQKRMFPPPLNKSQRMSYLIPQPQQNDGRFKKPRQAGTTVQTKISLEPN